MAEADRGVDGEGCAARASFGSAENHDTAGGRASIQGFGWRLLSFEDQTQRLPQFIRRDRLLDETARTLQNGAPSGLQRVPVYEDEDRGYGQVFAEPADQLDGIGFSQIIIDDDHIGRQAQGTYQRQVTLRHREKTRIPRQLSQNTLYIFLDALLCTHKENLHRLTRDQDLPM